MSDYRVYPTKMEFADQTTGEIVVAPTGTFRMKKRELRPGDALKMCRVLGDRTIPDLVFANGQGNELLAAILRRAARRLRMDRRHHLQLLRTIAPPLALLDHG